MTFLFRVGQKVFACGSVRARGAVHGWQTSDWNESSSGNMHNATQWKHIALEGSGNFCSYINQTFVSMLFPHDSMMYQDKKMCQHSRHKSNSIDRLYSGRNSKNQSKSRVGKIREEINS